MDSTTGAAGNDPDAASRVDCPTGMTTVGNVVGSCQADQFASHTHGPGSGTTNFLGAGSGGSLSAGANVGGASTTAAAGGNETRPKNVYVNYLIKI